MSEEGAAAKARILIVEDEYLVGEAVRNAIQKSGWEVVGPADTLDAALSYVDAEAFDAAVLDLNVEGRLVWPVASMLKQRGIPFLFLTGYHQSQTAHPDHAAAPTLGKPFSERDLVSHVSRLLDARTRDVAADAPNPPIEGE